MVEWAFDATQNKQERRGNAQRSTHAQLTLRTSAKRSEHNRRAIKCNSCSRALARANARSQPFDALLLLLDVGAVEFVFALEGGLLAGAATDGDFCAPAFEESVAEDEVLELSSV